MRLEPHTRTLLYLALFLTGLMVLYASVVLGYYSQCYTIPEGPSSLGLSFGYSKRDVLQFFKARNTSQLICYQDFIRYWDMIFPLLYGLSHLFWLRYLYTKRFILLIPIIHIVLDWTENLIELAMVDQFLTTGTVNRSSVNAGSFFTLFKWSTSLITYLLIATGIVSILIKRYKTRRSNDESSQ